MSESENWEALFEQEYSAAIEHKVVAMANTFHHFGNVTELFIPNALQTAVNMISHDPASGERPWLRPQNGPQPRPEPARNTLQNPR